MGVVFATRVLEGIYLEVLEEDSSRIFIRFPSVSFQGHGLY